MTRHMSCYGKGWCRPDAMIDSPPVSILMTDICKFYRHKHLTALFAHTDGNKGEIIDDNERGSCIVVMSKQQ